MFKLNTNDNTPHAINAIAKVHLRPRRVSIIQEATNVAGIIAACYNSKTKYISV